MAKKLLDQARDRLRTMHYSYRTEETYVEWMRRYILFHKKRHPAAMGAPEIQSFLTHLASDRSVAASTQNQALSAVLFLYREVLHKEIEPILLSTAKRPARLPAVLTREEVLRVIDGLKGNYKLMAQLLYGSGLRVMECVRLRIKDIDFDYKTITVRDGKGEKDRVTPVPDSVVPGLLRQIERVRILHEEDLAALMRWIPNTQMPHGNLPGNTSFLPRNALLTPAHSLQTPLFLQQTPLSPRERGRG
jgi:integrase